MSGRNCKPKIVTTWFGEVCLASRTSQDIGGQLEHASPIHRRSFVLRCNVHSDIMSRSAPVEKDLGYKYPRRQRSMRMAYKSVRCPS